MSSKNILIDHRFNVKSYEQYLIDAKEKKFNKLCMTQVMNADMMIAHFGEEQYNKTCAEILQMGNVAYEQMGISHLIHVYINNYKNFMAVANDDMSNEDFFNLMRASFEQYELSSSQETTLGGVSRFAVVFGDDLVNKAKSAYYMHQNSQNNFLVVSDEKEKLAEKREEEVELFELLNYAIKNNKVVPFYQGIYNNELGKITKYEALMRIYNKDGKVCPPGMFLEVAKNLKLYLTLSKMTIDRALKDFEDKESELSLNISLSDIKSEDFRAWFLARLKQHNNPKNVIVEFVETENYNAGNEMGDFLDEVREIGCQIAVDDFGVGFATYTSIVSLKPDIIKIDGDIIKKLVRSEESRMILDSICYMARLINSSIVAEFVENDRIQGKVIENNIQFSQGYYFAKPQPIEELKID